MEPEQPFDISALLEPKPFDITPLEPERPFDMPLAVRLSSRLTSAPASVHFWRPCLLGSWVHGSPGHPWHPGHHGILGILRLQCNFGIVAIPGILGIQRILRTLGLHECLYRLHPADLSWLDVDC